MFLRITRAGAPAITTFERNRPVTIVRGHMDDADEARAAEQTTSPTLKLAPFSTMKC